MRLWSIHPRYLDSKGLLALWREALLAQAVLNNKTRGYRNHPQLARFRQHSNPQGAIATYLRAVHAEALRRGYNFNSAKIHPGHVRTSIPVTRDQLRYEHAHLQQKLRRRNDAAYQRMQNITRLKPHPLFKVHRGVIEPWEKISPA
jgi:Pyrimidine dimer DNA glycosylase